MTSLLASGIRFYQRHLSPHKGFKCAYGTATKECTCSSFGLKVARRYPLFKALGLIQAQLNRCHHASVLLKDRYPHTEKPRTRLAPRSQQGIIDSCDCGPGDCGPGDCGDGPRSCKPSPGGDCGCMPKNCTSSATANECACDCLSELIPETISKSCGRKRKPTSSVSTDPSASDLKVNIPSKVLIRKVKINHPKRTDTKT